MSEYKAIESLTEAVKDLSYAMQLNFNKLNDRISKLEKDSKPKIDFYGYSYKGESFLDIFVDGEKVKHCHIDVDMFYDERCEDDE